MKILNKLSVLDKILLVIICSLNTLIIIAYNTKISWVVSDYYLTDSMCIKDTYRVKVKLGDYFLFRENAHEEYEDL